MFDYFNDMSYAGFQFWKMQMAAIVIAVFLVIGVLASLWTAFKDWRRSKDPRYKRRNQRR